MGLSGKDLISTVGAIAVSLIYYANTKGLDWPLISGTRTTILALGIIAK